MSLMLKISGLQKAVGADVAQLLEQSGKDAKIKVEAAITQAQIYQHGVLRPNCGIRR
jgi:hypothetical protein